MLIGRDNAEWTRETVDAMLVCLDEKNERLVKACEERKTALVKATPEWRGRFLNFVTACSRAIPGLKIGVAPAGRKKGLPTAHTCFNCICIPVYESEEQLEAALHTAADAGSGFGFR